MSKYYRIDLSSTWFIVELYDKPRHGSPAKVRNGNDPYFKSGNALQPHEMEVLGIEIWSGDVIKPWAGVTRVHKVTELKNPEDIFLALL